MQHHTLKELTTLPNLLTSFRFVSAPILLILAWHGQGSLYLLLLAATFASDVLDGMAARMLHQESDLGALLDSWGDIVVYITVAFGAWWLWPEITRRELLYVAIIVASYLLPVAIGIIKFHSFTSYHTWLVKAAVASVGLSYFVLFIWDIAWPFRIAALLSLLAAIEETAITFSLTELRSNVRSLWHVRRGL